LNEEKLKRKKKFFLHSYSEKALRKKTRVAFGKPRTRVLKKQKIRKFPLEIFFPLGNFLPLGFSEKILEKKHGQRQKP
jgi:hypothetical protein